MGNRKPVFYGTMSVHVWIISENEIGLSVVYAKNLEPRLYKGMDGIAGLEKDGYSFSEKKKTTLKKLFDQLK